MGSFHLDQCIPGDAPELARIHYEIFSKPPIYQVIFANVEITKVLAKYEDGFRQGIEGQANTGTEREAMYLKVTDRHAKEIAGYIVWVYLPQGYDPKEDPQAHADDMPSGSNKAVARELKRVTGTNRSFHEGRHGPHFLISLLGTHPKYERRGVASMLISCMFERADHEGLPCYVDSSKTAHRLYERHGFKDVSAMEVNLDDFEGGKGLGVQKWMGMMRESQRTDP